MSRTSFCCIDLLMLTSLLFAAGCSTSTAPERAASVGTPAMAAAAQSTAAPTPAPAVRAPTPAALPTSTVMPPPIRFDDAVARAGAQLLAQARDQVGTQPRPLVIDPLIDANTGGQTVSTARMGAELEGLVKTRFPNWSVQPLTRQSLARKPLLLIGTLTPVTDGGAVKKEADAFRIWLTLIDLETNRVVAKQIDGATLDSVNAEPLKYYSDSPSWHKDKTLLGYINSCQKNTQIGDLADPAYIARLPGAAVVNEAIMAYSEGKISNAQKLYQEASTMADPGDLRVLNGLYLTNWQLGNRDEARHAFERLVDSGLELKKLPLKLLFQPGKTTFNQVGDLPQQYRIWIDSLAQELGKSSSCIKVVGHTSRTGTARLNDLLSRQRAEAVEKLLTQSNGALTTRLTAYGAGSSALLIGLGTDDLRDALDRRVEFNVVSCV